ncbi:hypothetical protein LSH36_1425g00036 [Paralvinella palmiformis]|uniref:AMP-binding enzyme C-terminal domain-containing protein n=1 Tax=Paralvinella palmiformis TaxID=53620 RepID=A0AAD9IUB6_9ANNE|nr:hypothetical protein LSH36_1425g00036 [Paralvinella palmiformis]
MALIPEFGSFRRIQLSPFPDDTIPPLCMDRVPRLYPTTLWNVNEVIIREKVAPYKQLKGGVEFRQEIPKSPSGKILRRILRDQLHET